MKKNFKILFLINFLISIFLLSGCSFGDNDSNILDKLINKLDKSKSYYITGNMEIVNNEDTYTYNIEVSYQKGDYYKVDLVNNLNNHEQVILRNDDGVYVITPSLNKSYKFQSDWPYNNSQIYLLSSIYDDLKSDEDRTFKKTEDGYLFTSTVNYPNNKNLVKQNVYINKNNKLAKVEVVDKEGNVGITMTFKKIEYNKKFEDDYFNLSSILKPNSNDQENDSTTKSQDTTEKDNTNETNDETNTQNNNSSSNSNTNTETNSNNNANTTEEENSNPTKENQNTETNTNTSKTASIDDIVYPMYLPDNTYLTAEQTIDTENGERLILTFGGDSSFILVEETIAYTEDSLVIPVSGDVEFLSDVVGVVSDNSVMWDSNGIEYYIVSDTIPSSELVAIAKSISVLPVSK